MALAPKGSSKQGWNQKEFHVTGVTFFFFSLCKEELGIQDLVVAKIFFFFSSFL